MGDHNKYFDEAYFQRGEERGTAYRNYASSAINSPTFLELAKAIKFIFEPKKCLEIGCATGAIVKNLNDLGIDAYGIDVSEWAINNKLHDNVILSGAEDLPFDNDTFDLVYSSHALEHIPSQLAPKAFSEIDRVSREHGFQFHMLPIVGTYPYNYDHDTARSNLRADPTHNILESLEWWLSRWEDHDWKRSSVNICLVHDVNGGELSSGQFILGKKGTDDQIIERAFAWNGLVHRHLFTELESRDRSMAIPTAFAPDLSTFSVFVGGDGSPWSDYDVHFPSRISIKNCTINLLIELTSSINVPLRMAFIDDGTKDSPGVLEFWATFSPGISYVQVPIERFTVLEGHPDIDSIAKFSFGGALGDARIRVLGSIVTNSGSLVPLR